MNEKRLIEFLYLLMRDAAPTGEIVRIVRMMNYDQSDIMLFSSPELLSYATRLTKELLNGTD